MNTRERFRRLRPLLFIPAAGLLLVAGASAQFRLDIEGGGAWAGYNDIRVPGAGGTFFSLTDDLNPSGTAFYRLRLDWQPGGRHTLSVLYAPLSIKAAGRIETDLYFFRETFPVGSDLRARYTFNSYRLTYRYELVEKPRFRLGIGVTIKVRDAAIRIEGGGKSSEKANVGPVPLLNLVAEWRFSRNLGMLLEADALAAPQGRAEDVFLGLLVRANDVLAFKAGYRVVEGGADNDEVYNFALIHYLAVGAVVRF